MLAVASTVALGHWQQSRVEAKLALASEYAARSRSPSVTVPDLRADPGTLQFRHVMVKGEYLASSGFLLDNQVLKGVPGYHVITPFKIQGSSMGVLVDRGWIAAGLRRDQLPDPPVPKGPQTVEGVAVTPSGRFLELAPDAKQGPLRQNIVIERLEAELKLSLQPIVIQQISDAQDGLVREWPLPDAGADKNRAYAIQWYSFAALALVLYIVLNLKRVPRAG